MKITEEKIIKIVPSKGKTLTNGEVFSKLVYLGTSDKVENWTEITDAEAEKLQAALLEAEAGLTAEEGAE